MWYIAIVSYNTTLVRKLTPLHVLLQYISSSKYENFVFFSSTFYEEKEHQKSCMIMCIILSITTDSTCRIL